MKLKLKILAAVVASGLVAAATTVPADGAELARFAYGGSAGGTKITAVGTSISSSPTAGSALYGITPGTDTNQLATVTVGQLATVNAISTDVTAKALDDGFELDSHARTGKVSLLNGLITVDAVDTTSVASSSHGTTPHGDTNSQLLNLVISGKKYPVSIGQNTGVTIPGVATVMINASSTAYDGNTVVTFGGALVVRLLAAKYGVAAGAEIVLNPTFALVQPAPENPHAPSLGGVGYGSYAVARAGDEVTAETGRLGYYAVPLAGTGGTTLNNHVAKADVGQIFHVGAIDTDVFGLTTENYANVEVASKLADATVFKQLLGGVITATAIGTRAKVTMVGDTFDMSAELQFVKLRIAGHDIPIDVAPNTQIHVANLGTVTINEQRSVAVPGWVHAIQVVGLHIVLDTAGYGLPVGAEVQVGVSQALVWR